MDETLSLPTGLSNNDEKLIKNILGRKVFDNIFDKKGQKEDTADITLPPEGSVSISQGTVIRSASVKVMLSYNYCHFEVSMSLENDNGVTLHDIDEARKNCCRLNDKAIAQYKVAKDALERRVNTNFEKDNFERRCQSILQKAEGDRTVNELAMLKQYQDENWRKYFDHYYDYEDTDDDTSFK